jgi:hypothetical protein
MSRRRINGGFSTSLFTTFSQWMWNENEWNYSSERFVKWGEMKWNSWNSWNVLKLECEKQKDLLNSIKRQSLESYQSFRPRDLFSHLKDLVIVLIVVKSLETSTSVSIRISCFEFRQWGVWVSHPHVHTSLSFPSLSSLSRVPKRSKDTITN